MEILAAIGHILLIILFVVLGLIVLLIALPVVYRVKAAKPEDGDFSAKGLVRWLFGAVWFTFEYGKDGFVWDVRFVGIPAKRIYTYFRNRRFRRIEKVIVHEGPVRAKKQPTIRPGERTFAPGDEPKVHHIDSENRRYFKDERVFGGKKKPTLSEKIRSSLDKIRAIMELIRTGTSAFRKAWPFLWKILKHIRPRKIEGDILFGLDDPSSTGMLLGLLGSVYPFIPEKLEITPDFQEKRFSCDLFAGGHLFLIYVIINLIRIIRIAEIRELIKILNVRRRKNG